MTSVRLPDVLPRAAGRRPRLGALRRRRRGGDPVARVLVLDRRGDLGVPVRGAVLLPHREGARRAEPRLDRRARSSPSLVAPCVRGELIVIPIVVVLALAVRAWSSERARRGVRPGRRATGIGFVRARRSARSSSISGIAQPSLAAVVRRHDVLEAPRLRARRLGGRRARDRARRHPARRRPRRARPGARRASATRALRMFRCVAIAGDHRLRPLHRHEGGLPLDASSRRASRSGTSSTSRRCSSSAPRSSSSGGA